MDYFTLDELLRDARLNQVNGLQLDRFRSISVFSKLKDFLQKRFLWQDHSDLLLELNSILTCKIKPKKLQDSDLFQTIANLRGHKLNSKTVIYHLRCFPFKVYKFDYHGFVASWILLLENYKEEANLFFLPKEKLLILIKLNGEVLYS